MLQMKSDSVPTPCHQGRASSALDFVFSVFVAVGKLQPKVDQKEQNEHGDYVLDVKNIEKFKIKPYKYT